MEPVWAQSFSFLALRLCSRGNSSVEPVSSLWDRAHEHTESLAALPAVVSKSLVGLGHAVHVVLLLDGGPTAIGRVEQLIRQFVDHPLLAAAAAVGQNPTNGQRRTAVGVDLDRDLIVDRKSTRLNSSHLVISY